MEAKTELKQGSPRTRSKELRVNKQKPTQRSPRAQPAQLHSNQREHRHSFDSIPKPEMAKETTVPTLQRRSSSFASPSFPWARRRSFLSPSMLNNEKHLVYELSAARAYGLENSNIPTYSISLRESQGFTWNQDLFASQYQQQSSVIYDDGDSDDDDAGADDDDDDNAIMDDEDDEDEDDFDTMRRGRRRFSSSRRAYSYSMSNSEGVVQKVKVIDVTLDDEEEDEDEEEKPRDTKK